MIKMLIEQLDAARYHLESKISAHSHVSLISRALRRIRNKLLRPLRLAVIGEVNSGKTSLTNVLIGNITLPTQVITNTRYPTLLHYSKNPTVSAQLLDGSTQYIDQEILDNPDAVQVLNVGLPNDFLKSIEIIDSQSFSDAHMTIDETDLSYLQADAFLWCTSATGPWKHSEQEFWDYVPDYYKERSLLVVTRKDILNDEDRNKIFSRLKYEVGDIFRDILFISSIQAIQSREVTDEQKLSEIWSLSGAENLTIKVIEMISEIRSQRFRSAKAVVDRITERYIKML